MSAGLDIIGDVHGEMDGLRALLARLGYDMEGGVGHPDDRRLVFVGDLVDGGPDSLGVAELVLQLCERERALCLMGNHEINLLESVDGGKVRASTRPTYDDVLARADRWAPVLSFFRRLPLAIETDALRIVHAVWDTECLAMLSPLLEGQGPSPPASFGVRRWWGSPVVDKGLLDGLPDVLIPKSDDVPHAIVLKGLEIDAGGQSITDGYGTPRTNLRECWWQGSARHIPRDKLIVFGHYHHHPPIDGAFTPPHPFGTDALKAWSADLAPRLPDEGDAQLTGDVGAVCVDFNVKAKSPLSRVGALRWPERTVVWAR
jgi:hypothetical protein